MPIPIFVLRQIGHRMSAANIWQLYLEYIRELEETRQDEAAQEENK